MKVLVDTNVVLDSLLGRDPFFDKSDKVIKICGDKKADGFLAAHSITNMFFIIQKNYDIDDCRDILLNLFEIFQIEQIDAERLKAALCNANFDDIEDGLQNECAVAVHADYIVTRNKKDFQNSTIPCIDPDEFLQMFAEDQETKESVN